MSISETVKRLLGITPVDVSELNRRATLGVERPKTKISDPLAGITITEAYKTVRALIEEDCPVTFVTGNAGTGKSTLIRYLRNVLTKRMVVVAPTGVAALNAGGVTIHSFFHLPPKIHEDEDIKLVYDRKLYQKLELLIVDEVSMVRCDLMDSIDRFLKKNRGNDLPFGGVRLLLIGDLFQLPPVVPKQEWDVLQAKGFKSPYFFSSFGIQKTHLVPVELTEVVRQRDHNFVKLLNQIRVADNVESVIRELNERCCCRDGFREDITLTCTNNDADKINRREMNRLPSREYSFKGKIEGKFSVEHDKLPTPFDLRLKVGARVMFTKNKAPWVNGTLGIVREIEERTIRVELVSESPGAICDVQSATWETYKYEYDPEQDQIVARKVGQYTQYPLMLAWAITIYKSQGKTLDNVLVDFGNGAGFASGQVYVALSRCRTIEGLSLKRPLRTADIQCDPLIKRFYQAMTELKGHRASESGARRPNDDGT